MRKKKTNQTSSHIKVLTLVWGPVMVGTQLDEVTIPVSFFFFYPAASFLFLIILFYEKKK
jgi:hypothetical protein